MNEIEESIKIKTFDKEINYINNPRYKENIKILID